MTFRIRNICLDPLFSFGYAIAVFLATIMDLHIQKNDQQLGPFSRTEVESKLRAGILSPTDYAWYEGMEKWRPLAELFPEVFPSSAPSQSVPLILPKGTAFLCCLSGPDQGKRLILSDNQTFTIGTSSDSNLLSNDPDVLPQHAKIAVRNRHLFIETIEDTPVFVDGVPTAKAQLSAKQQIRIGRSLWQVEIPRDIKASAGAVFGSVAGKISSAAGLEQLQDFRASNILSAVFKKRTAEEIEVHFAAGTPFNTPDLSQIDTRWPQPWAFFRAFLVSIGVFFGLYYACSHFENPKLIPSVILVGSLAVPLSVLVLFYELNAPRNISMLQIVKVASLGGMSSIFITMFLHRWTQELGFSWLGASVAGIVEETAKMLALLLLVKNARYPWSLNGMLFGACVGTRACFKIGV